MDKRLVLLFLPLLLLVCSCSGEFQEEAVAKAEMEKPKAVPSKVQIPVIQDFIPKFNFEQRKEKKTHVVLHFTSNAALNQENPYVYEDIRKIFMDYDVSPHYMIDRNGVIYYLLPENRVARHSGKGDLKGYPQYKDHLNEYSIGIELMAIGTVTEMESMLSADVYKKIPPEHIGYTEAQYNSLNLLLNDILGRNNEIKRDRMHIVGHDEYAHSRKTDPGTLFDWSKIIP